MQGLASDVYEEEEGYSTRDRSNEIIMDENTGQTYFLSQCHHIPYGIFTREATKRSPSYSGNAYALESGKELVNAVLPEKTDRAKHRQSWGRCELVLVFIRKIRYDDRKGRLGVT